MIIIQQFGGEVLITWNGWENLTKMEFKSPYIGKSEKSFCFVATLITFVIAYTFSIMPNTCVHK